MSVPSKLNARFVEVHIILSYKHTIDGKCTENIDAEHGPDGGEQLEREASIELQRRIDETVV